MELPVFQTGKRMIQGLEKTRSGENKSGLQSWFLQGQLDIQFQEHDNLSLFGGRRVNIYSFNEFSLSACYIPDSLLGIGIQL